MLRVRAARSLLQHGLQGGRDEAAAAGRRGRAQWARVGVRVLHRRRGHHRAPNEGLLVLEGCKALTCRHHLGKVHGRRQRRGEVHVRAAPLDRGEHGLQVHQPAAVLEGRHQGAEVHVGLAVLYRLHQGHDVDLRLVVAGGPEHGEVRLLLALDHRVQDLGAALADRRDDGVKRRLGLRAALPELDENRRQVHRLHSRGALADRLQNAGLIDVVGDLAGRLEHLRDLGADLADSPADVGLGRADGRQHHSRLRSDPLHLAGGFDQGLAKIILDPRDLQAHLAGGLANGLAHIGHIVLESRDIGAHLTDALIHDLAEVGLETRDLLAHLADTLIHGLAEVGLETQDLLAHLAGGLAHNLGEVDVEPRDLGAQGLAELGPELLHSLTQVGLETGDLHPRLARGLANGISELGLEPQNLLAGLRDGVVQGLAEVDPRRAHGLPQRCRLRLSVSPALRHCGERPGEARLGLRLLHGLGLADGVQHRAQVYLAVLQDRQLAVHQSLHVGDGRVQDLQVHLILGRAHAHHGLDLADGLQQGLRVGPGPDLAYLTSELAQGGQDGFHVDLLRPAGSDEVQRAPKVHLLAHVLDGGRQRLEAGPLQLRLARAERCVEGLRELPGHLPDSFVHGVESGPQLLDLECHLATHSLKGRLDHAQELVPLLPGLPRALGGRGLALADGQPELADALGDRVGDRGDQRAVVHILLAAVPDGREDALEVHLLPKPPDLREHRLKVGLRLVPAAVDRRQHALVQLPPDLVERRLDALEVGLLHALDGGQHGRRVDVRPELLDGLDDATGLDLGLVVQRLDERHERLQVHGGLRPAATDALEQAELLSQLGDGHQDGLA
mmetsp:Transcript_71195/g.208988  ORF Transcript_71195/g.208988 Transcript_71195/m.208988 type:complete len:842 (+) Transcript_71195:17-2542(+)